jgi:hypothetical protein
MDFMKAAAIVIAGMFPGRMIHRLVDVARLAELVVDIILIRIHPAADLKRLLYERRNGPPLDIGEHRNDDVTIAL